MFPDDRQPALRRRPPPWRARDPYGFVLPRTARLVIFADGFTGVATITRSVVVGARRHGDSRSGRNVRGRSAHGGALAARARLLRQEGEARFAVQTDVEPLSPQGEQLS